MMEGWISIAADVSHDEIRSLTLILVASPPSHVLQPGILAAYLESSYL